MGQAAEMQHFPLRNAFESFIGQGFFLFFLCSSEEIFLCFHSLGITLHDILREIILKTRLSKITELVLNTLNMLKKYC